MDNVSSPPLSLRNSVDSNQSKEQPISATTSVLRGRKAAEVKSKSHRKTVHYIACGDCGATSIIIMLLLGAFLMALLRLFETDKRGHRPPAGFFAYLTVFVKVIAMISMLFNVCICVQLMHHTKPENEKLDVLRRAEFWKSYNIFLVCMLPFQIGLCIWFMDIWSAVLAGIFWLLRIGFLVVVHRYIRELHTDLTAFYIQQWEDSQSQVLQTEPGIAAAVVAVESA